ncbi:MAG: bifunctional folylpolyglutamate synthase/dihydrofolate synthase [Anaerolineae bacterium]|jgi:dihydrofolate synthase/folylpolyglutamate synthase|nr:bifunctional folylpolyglutamate synthase/dihydrofolate synthase [Anaerolineae bacterium]MBT3713763.1 bifunctional folylpolyglutamate synthase/dihydrofolate synthase [Anaerolineae bacterium]MBT4312360.1 bifunctional folylpolyglutamate synthase/dihydrofolate synthase [Anaerolineae bacterium]MBT4457326.1 bifunctional folylpolyglutamate synthase/dihydrofolate synthase [Anaerolineae bacterium]MBT4842869.1 bifunctional folylpolyglutamate synthase/dihydrofolate synthase [Anaerolineae bacterium]
MNKSYQEALDYLYSFVNYSFKHSSELAKAEFNLDRMRDLMRLLGDPQNDYPIIHIAGSKGKGSTAAFVASALRAADYRVGLYTSPHLQYFTERMQVNGVPIPQDEFVALVEKLKPAIEQVPFITTFELATALGFLHFSRQKITVAVVEVGLGGRLDATNIITPLVSVITSISLEHTAVLGDTLTKIAREKAGIVKTGYPFVASPQKTEVVSVFDLVAEEHDVPLTLVGRDVFYRVKKKSIDGQMLEVWMRNGPKMKLSIPLLGEHQVENAVTAYTVLLTARREGLIFNAAQIKQGFADTQWAGRFEIWRENPPIVLDSAHNPDSISKLRQTLEEYYPDEKVVLIFGVSEDKNITEMLMELAPRLEKVILTKSEHPRAVEAQKMIEFAEQAGVAYEAVEPVEMAVARALEIVDERKFLLLSAGSIFLTAAVRATLSKK